MYTFYEFSPSYYNGEDMNYVPPPEGGEHIVFGADPVGVCVCVASFRHDIF